MRHALVDINNLVANIVLWDGNTDTWKPPAGLTAVRLGANSPVGVGDVIDANGVVVNKAVVPLEQTNGDFLRSRAVLALQTNITYLGFAAPTNAQVVAQVAALTKECSALIRLLLNQLDSTSGA